MSSFTSAARELRERVKASKLPFKQLAREAGVSDQTIAYFVRTGSARPTTLDRIRDAVDKLATAVNSNAH